MVETPDKQIGAAVGFRVEKPTILLIDDSQDDLELTARFLRRGLDADIILETNPLDALQRVRERPIDLCLVDLMMPELNGINFAKRIRRSGRGRLPPILFVSGCSDDRLLAQAVRSGGSLIHKPVYPRMLAAHAEGIIRGAHGELDARTAESYRGFLGPVDRDLFLAYTLAEIPRLIDSDCPVTLMTVQLDPVAAVKPGQESLLLETEQLLFNQCRKHQDVVWRDSDRFIIYLENVGSSEARAIADRWLYSIPAQLLSYWPTARTLSIGVSTLECGVAHSSFIPEVVPTLMEQALIMLEASQSYGGDQVTRMICDKFSLSDEEIEA